MLADKIRAFKQQVSEGASISLHYADLSENQNKVLSKIITIAIQKSLVKETLANLYKEMERLSDDEKKASISSQITEYREKMEEMKYFNLSNHERQDLFRIRRKIKRFNKQQIEKKISEMKEIDALLLLSFNKRGRQK